MRRNASARMRATRQLPGDVRAGETRRPSVLWQSGHASAPTSRPMPRSTVFDVALRASAVDQRHRHRVPRAEPWLGWQAFAALQREQRYPARTPMTAACRLRMAARVTSACAARRGGRRGGSARLPRVLELHEGVRLERVDLLARARWVVESQIEVADRRSVRIASTTHASAWGIPEPDCEVVRQMSPALAVGHAGTGMIIVFRDVELDSAERLDGRSPEAAREHPAAVVDERLLAPALREGFGDPVRRGGPQVVLRLRGAIAAG